MATVYTTMRKYKDISAALDQHHSFKAIDQHIYAYAPQLKWAFSGWTSRGRDLLNHQHLDLIQILQILLLNVWKVRSNDIGLHVHTQQDMVPHFSVTDWQNNARCTPFYTADVLNLKYEVLSPLQLGNLLGVRFGSVSMGSRAIWSQRKQSS